MAHFFGTQMSTVLIFSLLVLLSSGVAHKCDFYFVGNVHYRTHAGDTPAYFQGCKKGCYWNGNYTDDGVPACGKCSEIKDEIECVKHIATCQWTKSGKCRSQSCPSIAKARVSLYGSAPNDNSTIGREAQYRDQLNLERECIEGSPLEQKYNSLYWEDYKETFNYKYAVWNRGDTCTVPGSTFLTSPYRYKVTGDAAIDAAACQEYVGYTYAAGICVEKDCTIQSGKAACEGAGGCIYYHDAGGERCAFASEYSCVLHSQWGTRWAAGLNTSEQCESVKGCIFIPGDGGSYYRDPADPDNDQRFNSRDELGLTFNDKCLPMCAGFNAGTSTRKDCESMGCTFGGNSSDRQSDRKTTEDIDLCPAERRPPTRKHPSQVCGRNTSLDFGSNVCNDRLYNPDPLYPASCNLAAFTTEEDCWNAHGAWTPPPKTCRTLFSTTLSICEFKARDAKNYVVWKDLNSHGGNQRPGTWYEDCVQTHYSLTDSLRTENVVLWNGTAEEMLKYLTPDDHEKIYGYRTPEEYCQFELDIKLEQCQRDYDGSVQGCHQRVVDQQVNPSSWQRSHVQVKAARSACHRLYGCMYSKSNERCSVWAVWAFILAVVLSTCVVVIAVGVAAVFLLPSLKKSVTPS